MYLIEAPAPESYQQERVYWGGWGGGRCLGVMGGEGRGGKVEKKKSMVETKSCDPKEH